MPVTPYHFGLGAAFKAASPKRISFLTFCLANILIDLESLYNLANDIRPVHAFWHTYIGAALMTIICVGLVWGAQKAARQIWLPNVFGWKSLSRPQIFYGAALGAFSHIALDSVMHADIQPFWPFSNTNPMLGLVPLDLLHGGLIVLGLIGFGVVTWRKWR